MSLDTAPRRGRPRARLEILRGDRLAGLAPEELAAQFGTPLYVYDLDVVTGQVEALRRVLPPPVELAYAVKANPSLAVVAHLGALGLGADVASAGELATVVRAGIPPSRVVVTGPGKRDEELEAAVAAGVRAITVESLGELGRLERLASMRGVRAPVLLRAAAGESARLERVRLVGDDGAGKFGMDEGDLRVAARAAGSSPHLDLLGVHRFGASNVLEAVALAEHVSETVELGRLVAGEGRIRLRLVDAGGGLGIPYDPQEDSLDLVGLGRRLALLAATWTASRDTQDLRLLLEPGRFLVGPAGAYLCRVIDRKRVGESEVVILDGGIHHLLRPALVGQEHRVRMFGPARRRAWPVTLAGPLCSGLDVLAADAALPLAEPGDLVAMRDAGAYGFTESMPYFLSHPIPPEIVVRNGVPAIARARRQPAAWLAEQVIPDWATIDAAWCAISAASRNAPRCGTQQPGSKLQADHTMLSDLEAAQAGA